jgi:hypothetical protein
MFYPRTLLPLPPEPISLPVFLQAPWPYSGTATGGGQTASPPGR